MVEKVIFSLLGLGVRRSTGFFRHYLFASASFLFFRADPHANVMAWLWHHLRRRSADQTHHQEVIKHRRRKGRRYLGGSQRVALWCRPQPIFRSSQNISSRSKRCPCWSQGRNRPPPWERIEKYRRERVSQWRRSHWGSWYLQTEEVRFSPACHLETVGP